MGAPGGGSPNSRGYPGCTAAPTPRLPAGSRGRAGNVPSVLLDSAFPHGGQPQPPLLQKQWEGRLGDLAKSTCSGGSDLMPPQPQNSCLSSARGLRLWKPHSAPSASAAGPPSRGPGPDPNPALRLDQVGQPPSLAGLPGHGHGGGRGVDPGPDGSWPLGQAGAGMDGPSEHWAIVLGHNRGWLCGPGAEEQKPV